MDEQTLNQTKKVLLVDGHSIANRAFYGLPLLSNSQGIHTNAILGFFNILFKTIDEVDPDLLAVAFDLKAPTFRHKTYSAYKGTRSAMPAELLEQIPLIQKLLQSAGIPLLMKEGFEADDLLGTIAKTKGKEGMNVLILSGDRDLLQLVDEKITLLIPKTKGGTTVTEVYHPGEVEEKYGVSPYGYLQMKALMGDSSDNIPGVPSIGEKTASKIIQAYGTLDEAIAHADQIKPAKAGSNLSLYQDQARLSLYLATIVTEVEDAGEVTMLEKSAFASQPFLDGLKTYELRSLIARATASYAKRTEIADAALDGEDQKETEEKADEAFAVVSASEMAAFLSEHEQISEAAFLGLFEWDSGEWMSLGVLAGEEFVYCETVTDEVKNSFRRFLLAENVVRTGFDIKGILRELLKMRQDGREIFAADDLMIASYLLNAVKGSYQVDDLSMIYEAKAMKSAEEILGSGVHKKHWSEMDPKVRFTYIKERCRVLEKVRGRVMEDLENKKMLSLYQDIELPLCQVLASMETWGISCETGVLDEFGVFLSGEIEKLQNEIYEIAGKKFNINSTKQLGAVLFEDLALPAGKKTKTGYSTSAEELEKMRFIHPVIGLILQYRQLSKLQSTYVEGLRPFVKDDGHIHCNFQQTVTATGRLSCSDPNLQNIPIREELGRALRRAFVPSGPDFFFMDADYSQIELRLLAHMSGDERMIEAYQSGADIHRLTASQVLHIPYEEVTPRQRSSAKAVNFGIVYGISAFSLSQDLGISVQEAKDYIDSYFDRFQGVKQFLDDCVSQARKTGYGVTLFGRRRQIEELRAKNFQQRSFGERVAKNMPIQGTAADIIKIAMNKVYYRMMREGLKSRLTLQVHDELLIEVYRPEEAAVRKILEEEMSGAADLKVPLLVDIHTGENWYEAK
ncbi:MAG: DNA polymerase I [Firmicutes bacterium]|nr:DNA polymerase I [Bacillota bacterium]